MALEQETVEPLNPTNQKKKEAREKTARNNEMLANLEESIKSCDDRSILLKTLRQLGRVRLSPDVAAFVYKTPHAEAAQNFLLDSHQSQEQACRALLKQLSDSSSTLETINQVLVCHFRIAEITANGEVPDGGLLYGIEDFLKEALEKQRVRTEIIKARQIDNERSQAFLDFLFFVKTIEAYDSLAPTLLKLQTEAIGVCDEVESVVNRYQ